MVFYEKPTSHLPRSSVDIYDLIAQARGAADEIIKFIGRPLSACCSEISLEIYTIELSRKSVRQFASI